MVRTDSLEALQNARLELLQVKEDHLSSVRVLPAPERAQAISDFQGWWKPKWDDVNVKLLNRLKQPSQSDGIASPNKDPGPGPSPGLDPGLDPGRGSSFVPGSHGNLGKVPRPPWLRSSGPPASQPPTREPNNRVFGLKRIWSRSSRASSDESANSLV